MKQTAKRNLGVTFILGLTAYGSTQGDRALSGGTIDAGIGAVGAAIVGGSIVIAAAFVAAAGAVTSVMINKRQINLD